MTTDGSTEQERRPGDAAHQGPGRWARRGAAGIGLPPGGSSGDGAVAGTPPAAADGDPDISPSLAGGHAGASDPDGS